MTAAYKTARGPFRTEYIPVGSRYELDNGYLVVREPGGGSHARPNGLGYSVVGWDPNVKDAGVDPGFAPRPHVLRAPDVAVGNVPDKPGWIDGAPELAIEYADVGQDEVKLQAKIRDLLAAGTKFLWVVRLAGPRHVEVHEPGKRARIAARGELLAAPGVLKNPVSVEALYDRDAAERATLVNLLQRRGYEDLEDVLAEGRQEGIAEGLRVAVRQLARIRDIPLTPERERVLEEMPADELEQLVADIGRGHRWG